MLSHKYKLFPFQKQDHNQIMKPTMFKIRSSQKVQKPQENQHSNEFNHHNQANKIDVLQIRKRQIDPALLQARDRHIFVQNSKSSEGKLNIDQLQAWIGKVCRDTISYAYRSYTSEQMSYEETKIYVCQEILTNISQFVDRNQEQISPQFYSEIDEILKSKVFPYLQLKYPPSGTISVNKKLNKIFKEINNMEVITNDFFYNSDIQFQYRQDGIYNDLIMQVINQIIKTTDMNTIDDKDQEDRTNFQDFEEYMSEMFEKVYDQQWMVQGKTQKISKNIYQIDQQEKRKYKEQVKEYTHYLIGRKIPENVQEFDSSEINSGFINIKSPTILRIITKWCEQLWQKFDNENYYIDRTEGLTMLKGKQVNILYPWLKKDLKAKMQAQKQKIIQYMKKVQINNYQQQYQIIKSQQSSKQALFLDKHERICGKFSLKIVKNLQNYIIIYLNRLIHGLMEVSKLLSKTMQGMPSWPHPPNLLSFKVGDLLRCKCSSKERQIIRIFEEIQQISENNPQKLKIIRIKNRLKLGTNDILINVRFDNCIIAQIQLKVDSKSSESKSSLYSYNFSHLIYEIERSYFGPITEMCNIWASLDPRIKMFDKLISKQKANILQKKETCSKRQKDHILLIAENNPFSCSECGKAYSNNNYVVPHYKCIKCNFWKCAFCTIKQKQSSDLIQLIIQDEQVRSTLKPLRCSTLPAISIGIFIESKKKELSYFKLVQAFEKKYLFKIVNQSYELFQQLKTQAEVSIFLKNNIVFQLWPNYINKLPKLQKNSAIISKILPDYVKKCYKFGKETISLNTLLQFGLQSCDLIKILQGNKEQKKSIRFIEMSMSITEIGFLSHEFKNLQFLNINNNSVKDLKHLAAFTKLQTLFAISNQISQFPKQICNLRLKQLSLYDNKLGSLPPQFCNMKSLKILHINTNLLISFPDNFGQLQNLRYLNAKKNKLSKIDSLTCPKLEYADLSQNELTYLPKNLQKLANLTFLNVRKNQIAMIQPQFSKLKKLKELIMIYNPLTQIPVKFYQSPQLSTLNISYQKLRTLNMRGCELSSIKDVNLQNNIINEIKDIQGLKNIESLRLGSNQLQKLPQNIHHLSNLKILNLYYNQLTELPENIGLLPKLKTLIIYSNLLKSFPSTFYSLKLQMLNFNRNNFSQIPIELMSMKSLKSLQFQGNLIQFLPQSIGSLRNLQLLNISLNKIKQLPLSMLNLKKLKKIYYRNFSLENISPVLLNFASSFSSCRIKNLPQTIPRIQNVERLIFDNNFISIIPNSISSIVSLKILSLNVNCLTQICDSIFSLYSLNTLSLNSNLIQKIPQKIEQLTELKVLLLNDNKIKQIPNCLQNHVRRGLQFQFLMNPIAEIPQWIFEYNSNKTSLNFQRLKLKRLTKRLPNSELCIKINLDRNQLQTFPQIINQCYNLTSLTLSNNQIRELSNTSFNFSSLLHLNLSVNKIEEIPEGFNKLKVLAHFYIQRNPLKKLPQSFKNVNLQNLYIDLACFQDLFKTNSLRWIHTDRIYFTEQDIQSLPQCFGQIGYLKEFIFQGNTLKKLPQSFVKLKSLIKLQIQCYSFQSLPKDIGDLVNLEYFKIASCGLSILPQSFSDLLNLRQLYILDSKLKQLPGNIGNLKLLEILSVRSNQLSRLPDSISQLTNLNTLSFRANNITELPAGIERCTSLQKFYAQNNLIKIIPKELEQLKSILKQQLHLQGNPISEIKCLDYVIEKGHKLTKDLSNQFKKISQRKQQAG